MSIVRIEIRVLGPTASGKSDVMEVIEHALKDAYGPHTMVVSHDLARDRALGYELAKPNIENTVMVITERSEARQ
ncbi:hypothetical protein D9M71_612550 [compost metagenome]